MRRAASERKVRHESYPKPLTCLQHALFRLTVHQAVLVLYAHESGTALRGLVGSVQLARRKVRTADLTDLTRRDELGERTERVLDRHARIRLVKLVEIDIVGIQAPEAVFDGSSHVVGVCASALVVELPSELGRYDDFAAQFSQTAANEYFTIRAAIGIRGVEEIDARVERGVDDVARARLVEAAAEIVAAETDNGDFERTDRTHFHQL